MFSRGIKKSNAMTWGNQPQHSQNIILKLRSIRLGNWATFSYLGTCANK